jgi:hypothetical protein
MRFGSPPDRPHEDRPLRTGYQTGSVLIAFHALPDVDVDVVMAEVEDLIRDVLGNWYRAGGNKLVEAVPEVA